MQPASFHELESLSFVPGTVEQLDAIMGIEDASFSAPWTRRMFEVELTDNPFSRFLVAMADASSDVVGYVCFWIVFEELRMMNLAVAPPLRHRGIGQRLLKKALETGIEQGARRALLEVRASNSPAMMLYERTGFVRTGVRAKYYTDPVEDAVLMEAKL